MIEDYPLADPRANKINRFVAAPGVPAPPRRAVMDSRRRMPAPQDANKAVKLSKLDTSLQVTDSPIRCYGMAIFGLSSTADIYPREG
jgi:hypothetical protein